MDMIRHKTPGMYLHPKFTRPLSERLQVVEVVVHLNKHSLSGVSRLHNMVRYIGNNNPGGPWHEKRDLAIDEPEMI